MRAAHVKTALAWWLDEKQTLALILIAWEHKRTPAVVSKLLVRKPDDETLAPAGNFGDMYSFEA